MAHELVLYGRSSKTYELPMRCLASAGGLKKHVYGKEGHLVSKKLKT
jgi:hypothetical protein